MEAQIFIDDALAELKRANHDGKHPFRYFTLATSDGELVDQRMVVMRKYAGGSVLIYTDRRTEKVKQITSCKTCHGLFWHPKKKLQLRTGMSAAFVDGEPSIQNIGNLKDYNTSQAPGTKLQGEVTYADEFSMDHFVIIELQMLSMDILQLDRVQHKRAQAKFEKGKAVASHWVVP